MSSSMNVPDWAGERGERWRRHLPGLEGMIAPVDAPLVDALAITAPARVVDVGCGAGRTSLAVLARAPAGTVVHGVDISPALVDVARSRVPPGVSTVEFRVADMVTAAPPEDRYDRLVSRFGVMFFADAPRAFANLARWLVAGGRFAFAVWGPANDNPWITGVGEEVGAVVPLPVPDPDAPGPFRYAEVDRLLALLARAGFVDLAARPWRGQLPVGGGLRADDAATFALTAFSAFAELLADAGEAARRSVHAAVAARYAAHERDGAVWMDASVHLVTGARGDP
jgi:SAM-dependent methyltransferase